jgi:hypothetical protein
MGNRWLCDGVIAVVIGDKTWVLGGDKDMMGLLTTSSGK